MLRKLREQGAVMWDRRQPWLGVESNEEGWLVASDNPDKKTWPTQPWPDGADPVGEVRWAWYSLP
jgi:hypothetical protein